MLFFEWRVIMNKTVNFEDIYNDFFGKNSYIKETQSVIKIDYEKEIKKLYQKT